MKNFFKPFKNNDDVQVEQEKKEIPKEDESLNYPKKVSDTKPVPTFTYIPPIKHKKLTIILIENTADVAKENDKLIKIVKSLSSSDLVTIIHYGSVVSKTEISNLSDFHDTDLQCNGYVGGMACLYDALVELEKLVSEEYMKIRKQNFCDIKVDSIDIVGIGTCRDNCSQNSKETGIDCFSKIVRRPKVTSKYFCLTEDSFLEAAEIGFHSIGAISRNY